MNRRSFLKTLAAITGATLTGDVFSYTQTPALDKYQVACQMLSECMWQTEPAIIEEKISRLFNHILTEFDDPVVNEQAVSVLKPQLSSTGWTHTLDQVQHHEQLDPVVKDTVVPVMALIVLFRHSAMHTRNTTNVPSHKLIFTRYQEVILSSSPFQRIG
jgi:hypothetical protein